MTVTVVTDSTATVPPDLVDRLGIVVVPIRIIVGDRTYPDGVRSHQELLDSTERVSTSGPSPGDFLLALEAHGAREAVIFTVSHDIAESTFLAARAAAMAADVPVRVVDSTTAAGGQGLIVLAAARAAAAGGSLDDVEIAAGRVIERVRLIATIPDLGHLARSGHVPGAGAWAARSIGLHPLIQVRNGRVRPLRPALSFSAAVGHMIDTVLRSDPGGGRLHLAVLQALDPDGGERIREAIEARVAPAELFVGSFGTAMVVHSGPGVLGYAWWWEDAERPESQNPVGRGAAER